MPDLIEQNAPLLVAALMANLAKSSVTYTREVGGSSTLAAIISDPQPAESAYPGKTTIAKFAKSDMAFTPTEGDTVAIESVDYTVFDVKERKIGLWVCALRKK